MWDYSGDVFQRMPLISEIPNMKVRWLKIPTYVSQEFLRPGIKLIPHHQEMKISAGKDCQRMQMDSKTLNDEGKCDCCTDGYE